MTTYLTIYQMPIFDDDGLRYEEIAEAFCSESCCRRFTSLGIGRDDPSYEFDETCANCGTLILACHNF